MGIDGSSLIKDVDSINGNLVITFETSDGDKVVTVSLEALKGEKGEKGEQGETGSCAITGDGDNIISLIVNDLVTGGAGNILSAEQGKRLAPLLELIGSVEHPSVTDSVALTSGKRYDGNLYNQPTNGTFPTTTNSNSGWGCASVDVKEGDVLKIIGTKSGADYRIYTIVNASGQRISVGSSASNQSYTSSSPLEVTMPANAAKVYVNLTYSGAAVSVVRAAWTETVLNRATSLQDGLMTAEQVAAFEELSAIVEEMGANSELLSTLIENVTVPAVTKNVQMTSGGRYDGNYYNTGNTGVFPTTINSASGWSYGNIACKEGDVLTIVGSKSGADYKIYTIVDADNKRISSGASSNQTYTSDSPLNVTMPANAAKVYINLSSVTSVKLTEPSYNEDQLRKATTEQDGLMTKEQVAALEAAGGEDVELLKSYIVDRTDTMTGTFVVGNLKNWNVAIGATYNGGLGDDNQNMVYCMFSVQAGDIVTLWCTTDVWNQGYIICDSSNKVIDKSGNNYSKSQSSPKVITIEQDGKIWIASNKSASYGASLSRTYRAFRNATAEQDGLMPKEIAALFGGDVSGDDAASLKLKSFAFIGDSFSAPGTWQSTMCSDLGSIIKSNRAVSGGAWYGTDSLSAYYQAQQLVSSNQAADYILCVLGTNDIAHWATYTLGNIVNSETIGTASGNVNPSGSITGGIQATLITLKNAFPNAIIKIGYTPAGYIHDAFNSIANVEALCDRLKELSHIYGVGYIETRDCGICPWMDADLHAYTGTTSGGEWSPTGHPSGAGQTRIGQYMARKMLSDL